MEFFDYCSACLVTGVKITSLTAAMFNRPFVEEFTQFLQIPFSSDKEVASSVCYECAALLNKFEKFRSRCIRAQEILSSLRQDHFEITEEVLQSVNREHHKLTSAISVISTELLTITNIQNENHIPTSEQTQPEINCVSNLADITLVKSEKQDEESTVNGYENYSDGEEYSNNDATTENNYIVDKMKTCENEQKYNKREKVNEPIFSNSILDSISDDEPLVNKVSKTTNNEIEIHEMKNTGKNLNKSEFDGYATVVFLTPEDAKKELLLRKESSNYIISPLKCELCYRGFGMKAAFENHMKKHSKDYGEYKCDICQLRFSKQRALCKHRLGTHKRKFCCTLCTYVCYASNQAKAHVSLHKGKIYPCEQCGQIFSMPNSLHMHKRYKHVTECVCELCGNTFATAKGLCLHYKMVHRQDKNEKQGPKCEECGIHFTNEQAWKLHLVLSSKHKVSNGCKHCGETFLNTEELKRHMRVHASKTSYRSHVKSEHPHSGVAKKLNEEGPKQFVCELCGLAFKSQCFLRYHQRRHTGERPYKCAQCHKTFHLANALTTHKAIHLQQKAHKCPVCDRVFTFKSALGKHMKIHLNIRPHSCTICDKKFISPCDVRLHIKCVHNKVPWPKRKTKRQATKISECD